MSLKIWYEVYRRIKKSSFSVEATTSKTNNYVKYVWYNKDKEWIQDLVNYAYEVSWWDIDFLSTITHESWWDKKKQSDCVSVNGVREKSYGLCQWNEAYYPEVLDDPNFWSAAWQVETCRNKYKLLDIPWTIFHWWYARETHYWEFIII